MNDCQRPVTPFVFETHQARMNEAYQQAYAELLPSLGAELHTLLERRCATFEHPAAALVAAAHVLMEIGILEIVLDERFNVDAEWFHGLVDQTLRQIAETQAKVQIDLDREREG